MRKTVVAVMSVLMIVGLFAAGASAAKLTRKKDSKGVYQVFNGSQQITRIAIDGPEYDKKKGYGVASIVGAGNYTFFTFKEFENYGLSVLGIYFLDNTTMGYAKADYLTLDLEKKSSMKASGKTLTISGRNVEIETICPIWDVVVSLYVAKNSSEANSMIMQAADNNGIDLSGGDIYAFLMTRNDKVVECPEEYEEECYIGMKTTSYNVIFVNMSSHEEISRVYFDQNKNMKLN